MGFPDAGNAVEDALSPSGLSVLGSLYFDIDNESDPHLESPFPHSAYDDPWHQEFKPEFLSLCWGCGQ